MLTRSVQRALKVLKVLAEAREEVGVTDIAAACVLSPATTHRLIQTLQDESLVRQNPKTGRYQLGIGLFHLGRRVVERLEVRREALPLMEEVRERAGECTYLNIADGRERVCVESLDSRHDLRVISPVGQRSPLHAGASAKCLLAYLEPAALDRYLNQDLVPMTTHTIASRDRLSADLETIRRQGYCISHGERMDGLWALAVPVRDYTGNVVASLAVSYPEIRYTAARNREILQVLRSACKTLSERLGYVQPLRTAVRRQAWKGSDAL